MTASNASLHNSATVVRAPSVVLSDGDGRLSGHGTSGWFTRDRRALALLEFTVEDTETVTVGRRHPGPSAVTFDAVARDADVPWRDATLLVRRAREVFPAGLAESLTLTHFGTGPRRVSVTVRTATDFAGIDAVKAGRTTALVPPTPEDGGVRWTRGDDTVTLHAEPPVAPLVCPADGDGTGVTRMTWQAVLDPREPWQLKLTAAASFAPAEFRQVPAARPPRWTLPPGTPSIAATSLADLEALLLADPVAPDDVYLAAGAPWYLTLFGRDSLWAARLLLPLGTAPAAGTLRALARRQGTRHDPEAVKAPGKILHEQRPAAIDTGQVRLSARYYGTIDATPLWICLLHEAWRAGLPAAEVHALLPHLVAAMAWLTGPDADPDGDGLVEYVPSTTGGLTHQGWKDSHDSFLHADGRHPAAPLALCEAQGYAHAAATAAVELAAVFGHPGTARWAEWAHRLKRRFRETFWIEDASGRYPAIALDGTKTPVPGATSNMAHLLGTGLLDHAEAASVAARLAAPDLTTRFGLRTLSAASPTYNPFSYHRGSVWPHDTAIAMTGLAAEGHHDLATRLAEGILRAATHFDGHAPELLVVLDDAESPLPYPAACTPQAWSAAAVVAAARYVSSPPGP